jgi:hypothetical protein
VLGGKFGPRREEVRGDLGYLDTEELHNLYSSPNIIRAIKPKEDAMGGTCSTHDTAKNSIQNFGTKTLCHITIM